MKTQTITKMIFKSYRTKKGDKMEFTIKQCKKQSLKILYKCKISWLTKKKPLLIKVTLPIKTTEKTEAKLMMNNSGMINFWHFNLAKYNK